jgi:hypothetical protein
MDDPTRRRWEKIADATIDRAFAAAMDDLKAAPLMSDVENAVDLQDLLFRWARRV